MHIHVSGSIHLGFIAITASNLSSRDTELLAQTHCAIYGIPESQTYLSTVFDFNELRLCRDRSRTSVAVRRS